MFDFIALVVAIVAFFFARSARTEVRILRARLDAFEAAPRAVNAVVPATEVAPPLAPLQPAIVNVPPPSSPPAPKPAIATAAPTPDITDKVTQTVAAAPEAPRPSFEERIGTRWVVWVGGLTLALGGLFMVRYSIEAGLLGPEVRVLLGGLFALALLAVGEFARRKETLSSIAPLPIANIPAILTAAGTAVAFATIYAAYALYDFLVPGTAFVLLGIVAMSTMAAALLHGPALAGLGLVGAFVTPMLVSSAKPDYWALYIYLAIVSAAAFALARIRMWRWLVLTTIAFTTFWTLPGLDSGPAIVAPHVFHVIACFVLAALLVVCGFMYGPTAEPGRIEGISSAALGASLFGATLIVLAGLHDDLAMIAFALLVAGTLFVARYAQAATSAVAIAAAFVAVVFLSWAIQGNLDMLVLPGGPLDGIGLSPIQGSVNLHLVSAAVFALGFGVLGFLAQGRSVSAVIPVIWAACANFVPIALLIALYARIAHLDRSVPFAILAVIIAAALAAATEMLSKREQRPGLAISTALFATGTLGALALALTFALEKGWLTIALSLMALGTAWISMQRPILFLRWLAAILAAIVCARMAYEPRVIGDLVGTTPILNWLLWGYGVPAASFWGASVLMRRRSDDAPLRMVESAAILFTVLLVFLEIRHYVNGGDVYRISSDLVEIALQVCTTLAMAIGLERLRVRSGSIVHNVGAVILTIYAGLASLGGLLFIANPNIWRIDVGGVIFNLLLLGYALPAILALLLSYTVAGHRKTSYANTIAGGALVMALAYVTLEIRRIYHGPVFSNAQVFDAEQYTLSIAWLVFGVALLAAGLIFSSQRARLASAVVIGLTVLKAFLVDMSSLTGVWRALSFMCLGLVLVAIGYLYQRILFSRKKANEVRSDIAGT